MSSRKARSSIRLLDQGSHAILLTGNSMDTISAVFEHGVFRPETPFDLPEGSRVLLAVQPLSKNSGDAEVLSVEERRQIRRRVVERMMRNPLPEHTARFNRDDMYDRC